MVQQTDKVIVSLIIRAIHMCIGLLYTTMFESVNPSLLLKISLDF